MSSPNSQVHARAVILAQRHAADAKRYFERHAYCALPALPAAEPGLGLVVVIPALAEPDSLTTLESVAAADRPRCNVELIWVVNGPGDASADVQRANARSLTNAKDWADGQRDSQFRCHVLDYRELPADHAGVGLARKLGMDTALARLAASRTGRGVIASLDADCRVAPNYLTALHDYFGNEPDAVGATIYFEHPLDDVPENPRQAIIEYELHLRCYKQGLHLAGSTYASHTVGSALAVRSEIYAQEGGMNRRAAGEDFYFVNKLLKRGQVGEIGETAVYPSARVSRRVPFGTGAAMWRSQTQTQTTYAPVVYRELQSILTALDERVRLERPMPARYEPFFDTMKFHAWYDKTRANVSGVDSLSAHVTRWLDGFKTMKFVNWLTQSCYPRVGVADAAREVLAWRRITGVEGPRAMLDRFRRLDRGRPG